MLNSSDPMPPVGAIVRDSMGRRWVRSLPPVGDDYRNGYWLNLDSETDDPESWIKVAGNYGSSEPTQAALVAPSSAARAVVLLHEGYHAGKVCFVTDPVECPGHQDAHDITQVLVNAGLLAWGEADVPPQGAGR